MRDRRVNLALRLLCLVPVGGRSRSLGPDARPVATPDDVDDPRHIKATGRVQLPVNVAWSGDAPLTRSFALRAKIIPRGGRYAMRV